MSIRYRMGYHVSTAGGLSLAFERALSIGCTSMQIFMSNPRSWSIEQPVGTEVEAFRKAAVDTGIKPVFAHMPYLPNFASPRIEVRKRSIIALKRSMQIADILGVGHIVAHLGSHLGEGRSIGVRNVAEVVQEVLQYAKKCMLLLENEAGQGNSVGSSPEELMEIYDSIGSKRIGFCIDTCHIFAAGYDITRHETMDTISSIIGMDRIELFHLNDAKYALGSKKDRHANIGYGFIGREGFRRFFGYRKVKEKAFILETPRDGGISAEEELRTAAELLKSS